MRFSNYSKIYECDLNNGEGVRITIFFSGCNHCCKGCYNKSTWNPNSGIRFDHETINLLLDKCSIHDGITFSGGDPLHRRNRGTVLYIARLFKERYPEKDLWMWTGYRFEDVQSDPDVIEILKLVDVVIDGKFECDNPTSKPWRGSDNQKLYRLESMSIDIKTIE